MKTKNTKKPIVSLLLVLLLGQCGPTEPSPIVGMGIPFTIWEQDKSPYIISNWAFSEVSPGNFFHGHFPVLPGQDSENPSGQGNISETRDLDGSFLAAPSNISNYDPKRKDSSFIFFHSVKRSKNDLDILLSAYIPFCPSGCYLGVISEGKGQIIVPGESEDSSKPRIVVIPFQNEEVTLALQLFPFNGPRNMMENPVVGSFSEVQTVYLVKALRVLLFSSLEFFSFFFFAFIYIRRPQDKFNLSFSLLNLSLAIWYPAYEGWFQYIVDSPWTWVIFGYSLGAFLPILFYEFTIGIFQAPRNLPGRILQFLFILLTIWPSLEYGLTGGHKYFGKVAFQIFLFILVFFYMNTLYIFFKYRRSSILSFRWVVTGLILVAVSSFYTVMSFAGFGPAQPWVNESFLVLTLLFSLALAKRYAEVFRALEKSEGKLKSLNESLESKVEERTKIIELQKAELVQKGRILAKDLSIAGKIQNALLPRELPVIPNAKISYRYKPMMEIGGDLLDVIYDPSTSSLGMFIGDVTGHGVSAALLASMLKMTLGDWSILLQDPSSLLLHIRNQFEGKLDGHFITATLVTVDLRSGKTLIANAGHPECLVLRKDGIVEFYRPKGVAIYEAIPTTYQTESVDLLPGDKVVLYTDGIPDSRNTEGEFFGEDRLSDLLRKNSFRPPEELCDSVIHGVQAFQGEFQHQDDMALLVVEYLG
ncbi:PP2C family protein-serine/threonine phosphatase [Leptospira sp. WS58.C1]|uniref:PP2C family protein-serine/threonine phosphatase n=1 Tax=Leptospira TaxID=171 RepID=UPI0002BF9B3D|nr:MULTISPECIES: SpoIIE family protein phosphatase [unclassified Leptospira]EMJ97465.1 stage II sporulation protein E [Leptospira sp. B5-022]MCR1794829.1 SpoIIE family protein phosphatase [Leptospira sp. id769339]